MPPEQLLKASVLMALYSIRSERAFCERLNYDLLFKWFLDLPIDAKAFDPTTFTKNRERLLDARDRRPVLRRGGPPGQAAPLRVERALLRRRDAAGGVGVAQELQTQRRLRTPHERRRAATPRSTSAARSAVNKTHASTTDPEARLARKCRQHRGAAVLRGAPADGEPQRLDRRRRAHRRPTATPSGPPRWRCSAGCPDRKRRRTVAADKGYDTAGFVADCRDLGFTPHVAQHTNNRRSAIDGRTTRHPGHRVSQRIRPRIEEPFGWIKTIAGGRKLRYLGRQRNRAWFLLTGATYNLLRITALDSA